MVDDKRIVRKVYEDDFDFAAIVRIDCSGCVEDGDAVLCCKPGARANLGFVANRNFYFESGRDECAFKRVEGDRVIDVGPEVKTGSIFRFVNWECKFRFVDNVNFDFALDLMVLHRRFSYISSPCETFYCSDRPFALRRTDGRTPGR